jgi:hypothetical protein
MLILGTQKKTGNGLFEGAPWYFAGTEKIHEVIGRDDAFLEPSAAPKNIDVAQL